MYGVPSAVPVVPIQRLDDPRLADYVGLRDRDLRRAAEGLFVGEQLLVVERMLEIAGAVRSVLVAERLVARVAPRVPPEVPLYSAPQALLEQVAGFPLHRGVLAIGSRSALPRPSLDELASGSGTSARGRLLLACEDIVGIDNIGMLFRVAAAFAADGVLLSPRCHDPLYRKSLRVSIGHALHVPFHRAALWPEALERLRERGIAVIGAALDDGAAELDALPVPERAALVVGTEFAGISEAVRRRCDALIRIPMAPGVDSLNVAVAAGICLHRFRRAIDRRAAAGGGSDRSAAGAVP
ncbi:MAG TPA: RNA methyltransferase [Phycisphaerales bacterium]|nr:RNA methyltransferase [Phycisphaerales bacterium]HMP36142.1 RNA methyltransferase [Phycisphaerales bacterium]